MTLPNVQPSTSPPFARRSFHYSWIVAGVTFLTLLITAGVRSTPGVLMIPLEQECGWTRANSAEHYWGKARIGVKGSA